MRMLRVTLSSEVECIRYRGNDPNILRRMGESGQGTLSDTAGPADVDVVFRHHVTFQIAAETFVDATADKLAAEFMDHTHREHEGVIADSRFAYRFQTIVLKPDLARIAFSWFEDDFHPIEFVRRIGDNRQAWLIRHSRVFKTGSQAVSFTIDDWLRQDRRFSHVRWFSEPEWRNKEPGQEYPI